MLSPDWVRRHTESNYLGLVASNGSGALASSVDAVLAGAFAGTLKSTLATVVSEMEWPADAGPPVAERAKRVASIDKQLDALLAKERDLMQAAAQARITI